MCAAGSLGAILKSEATRIVFTCVVFVTVVVAQACSAMLGDEPTKAGISPTLSPELKELIEKTFSADPEERSVAVKKLGQMGEAAAPAVPFLIRLLGDEGIVMGEPTELERLRRFPPKMSEHSVGNAVTDAISAIGSPAVEPCILALQRSAGEKRLALIYQLGHLEDARAFDTVVSLFDNPDRELVEAAVCACVHSTDPRLVPPLIRLMQGHESYYVRRLAALHFESHRDTRVVGPLIQSLKDNDAWVREAAAGALGEQRDPRAVPALLEFLTDAGQGVYVREPAARSLGKIGDRRAIASLLGILSDHTQEAAVRGAAADGLMFSGNRPVADSLIAVLTDTSDSPVVRGACATAIAGIRDERACLALTKIAMSVDDDLVVRFWSAIGVVELTHGAIDDYRVLAPIRDYRESFDGVEFYVDDKKKALKQVADGGKNRAVRWAAKKIIRENWGGPGATNEEPFYWGLFVLYCVLAPGFWIFVYRDSLERRQITLRSLFVLMTLIGVGLAFLVVVPPLMF